MEQKSGHIKKVSFFAMMLCLSLTLSFIEGQFLMLPLPFPGIKVGLANLTTLFVLLQIGFLPALLFSCLRALLSSFLFGSITAFAFSLAGGIFSVFAMWCVSSVYPKHLSAAGISIAGGVFHNVGQVLAAVWMLSAANYLYYLPVLVIFGVLFGFVNGLLYMLVTRGKNFL